MEIIMNLKYYLRGLGVGIVVTSLILGIGLGSRKETLSNEEIKEFKDIVIRVSENVYMKLSWYKKLLFRYIKWL